MAKKLVGVVTHFYDGISVAIVEVKSSLKVGDQVVIEGPKDSFEQTIYSMQIDMMAVKVAKA